MKYLVCTVIGLVIGVLFSAYNAGASRPVTAPSVAPVVSAGNSARNPVWEKTDRAGDKIRSMGLFHPDRI